MVRSTPFASPEPYRQDKAKRAHQAAPQPHFIRFAQGLHTVRLKASIMSDNGEVEVENPSGYTVLPKDVTAEVGTVKLFNKWSYEDVEVRDISLT